MEIGSHTSKIFISNVDSKLGFHLTQQLRDDHIHLNNFTQIVGSTRKTSTQQTHPIVHGTVNYQDNIQVFARTVLATGTIILDVRQASEETQFIVKLIQQRAKQVQAGRETHTQTVRIVAIGSHMSWAYAKPTLAALDTEDKEHALTKLLALDHRQEYPIKQSDRSRRIAHHGWVRQRQIEKSILNLNKYNTIRSCIVTTGLIYGKDVPSPQLADLISRCFTVWPDVHVYGDGSNLVPATHIDDLCNAIEWTLQNMSVSNVSSNYLIVVDQQLSSQSEIVQQLLKNSGFVKTVQTQQLLYLTKQQAILGQSVPLRRSSALGARMGWKSICQYFEQQFGQMSSYMQWSPKHYVVYAAEFEHWQLEQLDHRLSCVIQVFRQDDVAQQMCKSHNIVREQLDIHALSDAIEQKYLKPHHRQNYIIVLNQILLDVNVFKKYNLSKYQTQTDSQHLLSHKFKLHTHPHSNQHISDTSSPKHSTSQHNQHYPKQQNNSNKQNLIQKQPESTAFPQPKYIKKYAKIDQYLLDNVIGYVSEGILKAGPNPQLPHFIQALQLIYNRQRNASNGQI